MPHKFNNPHARCNMHTRCTNTLETLHGEGEGRTTSLHSVWAHTRTTQAYAKGCEAYTAYPRPSTGPRKDRAPLFYQSPHRSPHTSQVQLRCNGNGTTPRELPPPGHPPPRHTAHQIRVRPCIPTCTQSASWPLLLLLLVDVFLLLLILLLLLLHHHCFL